MQLRLPHWWRPLLAVTCAYLVLSSGPKGPIANAGVVFTPRPFNRNVCRRYRAMQPFTERYIAIVTQA